MKTRISGHEGVGGARRHRPSRGPVAERSIKRILVSAIVVAGAVAGFAIYTFGWRDGASEATPNRNEALLASSHAYVDRPGDVFKVPAIATRCVVSQEGGSANVVCAHIPRARHQVYFYKDRLQVWRTGSPGRGPVFSARP